MNLNFRPLGARGVYPDWVRKLAGRSGVYVIREGLAVVYVGESHTGRLKKTLLRHFQNWTGKTSGPTFARGSVEVAVIPTPAGAAVAAQNRLIELLLPDENTVGVPSVVESALDELSPF